MEGLSKELNALFFLKKELSVLFKVGFAKITLIQIF